MFSDFKIKREYVDTSSKCARCVTDRLRMAIWRKQLIPAKARANRVRLMKGKGLHFV